MFHQVMISQINQNYSDDIINNCEQFLKGLRFICWSLFVCFWKKMPMALTFYVEVPFHWLKSLRGAALIFSQGVGFLLALQKPHSRDWVCSVGSITEGYPARTTADSLILPPRTPAQELFSKTGAPLVKWWTRCAVTIKPPSSLWESRETSSH